MKPKLPRSKPVRKRRNALHRYRPKPTSALRRHRPTRTAAWPRRRQTPQRKRVYYIENSPPHSFGVRRVLFYLFGLVQAPALPSGMAAASVRARRGGKRPRLPRRTRSHPGQAEDGFLPGGGEKDIPAPVALADKIPQGFAGISGIIAVHRQLCAVIDEFLQYGPRQGPCSK